MGEKWIDFVKRIQAEGAKKDKDYSFKQAMVDAGKRKSEWKRGEPSVSSSKKSKKVGGKKRRSSTKKNRKSRSRSRK